MPIYEYACRKCGARFEHLARTLSEQAPRCPECGAARPAKQLSVFSAGHARRQPPCASGACDAEPCAAGACRAGSCPML
jgi:putative FmdB family regulatory protein